MDEMIAILDEEFVSRPERSQVISELQKSLVKTRIYRLPVKSSILCKRFRLAEANSNSEESPSKSNMGIVDENVVLVRLKARILMDMINSNVAREYFEKVQSIYDGLNIVCIIEGLNAYFRRCRAETNREFLDTVQAVDHSGCQDLERRKTKNKSTTLSINKVLVDSFFIRLQMELRIHLIHTKNVADTSNSIVSLFKAIAIRPYR
jgi:hypothetical protein